MLGGRRCASILAVDPVIRALLRKIDRDRFAALAGEGAHDIAQIVPEFRQWYAVLEVPETQPLAAEQARFKLFESVAALLKNYAQTNLWS